MRLFFALREIQQFSVEFCPNGAPTFSPGLPLRLPWERGRNDSQPQSGCVVCIGEIAKAGTTALRLRLIITCPQGSRSGNPGLEGTAPLGQAEQQWSSRINRSERYVDPQ